MMLRDGRKGTEPDLPEAMPEVWKRLSEKVADVRKRICGRIEKTLANATISDASSMPEPSPERAGGTVAPMQSAQENGTLRRKKPHGRHVDTRPGKRKRSRQDACQ